MTVRYYSSVAPETTLVNTITSSGNTVQVLSPVGLPALTPFTIALDYEAPNEELVNVTAVAGATLTVDRGIDGTGATAHNAGARVRHVTSARDFSDSRNHENSIDGVHGLAPGEDIVGTDSPQTLSNKTFVDATGSFLNASIRSTGTATTRIGGDGGGTNIAEFRDVSTDTNPVTAVTAGGALFLRNRAADDADPTLSAIKVTKSSGTGDPFVVQRGGTVAVTPDANREGFRFVGNAASTASVRAVSVLDPDGSTTRVGLYSSGAAYINGSLPTDAQLRVRAAPSQTVDIVQVQNSNSSQGYFTINQQGRTNALAGLYAQPNNNSDPALILRQNSSLAAGPFIAFRDQDNNTISDIDSFGNFNDGTFHSDARSVGTQFSAASGWNVQFANVVTRGGWAILGYTLGRTGGTITPTPGGNVPGEPLIGTIASTFRPSDLLGTRTLNYIISDGIGSGTLSVGSDTGQVRLTTWSTGGSIPNGTGYRMTLMYPIT